MIQGDKDPLVPGWGTGREKTRILVWYYFLTKWLLLFCWCLVLGCFLNSKILSLQRIVCTSRFSNLQNYHIYNFHASGWLNLIFPIICTGTNYCLLFNYRVNVSYPALLRRSRHAAPDHSHSATSTGAAEHVFALSLRGILQCSRDAGVCHSCHTNLSRSRRPPHSPHFKISSLGGRARAF